MEEPEAQQLPTVETVSNCQSVTDSSEDLPHKPPHRSNDLENSNVEEISGKTEDDLINGEPNGKISEETTDATVIEPQPITSNNGTLVEQIESNGAVEGILQVERAEVQPV